MIHLATTDPGNVRRGRPTVLEATEMLLKSGADPSIADCEGNSAFDYAIEMETAGMMDLFKKHWPEKVMEYWCSQPA